MGSLTESTVQARFNSGYYTGRKKDKRVGEKVARDNKVDEKVGNYWKNSLKCDELEAIKNIAAATREGYYRMSTEWLEGVRVMPVEAYHKFAPQFRDAKFEWQKRVDEFVAAYPKLVKKAKDRLKDLYDITDYPHASEIASKFYMEFRIFPFPKLADDDNALSLLVRGEAEFVKKQMQVDFANAQASAAQDLFARIEKRCEEMHNALSKDGKLYDSMFRHTVELCQDLKILNFANDPHVEALRQDMLKKLTTLNPDVIRAATGVPGGARELAAKEAQAIMARVAQMRGL